MRLNIKKTLSVALCMVMTVLSVPDVCVDKAEAAEFKTGTLMMSCISSYLILTISLM